MFDPNDYEGETIEGNAREERARFELIAQEADEREELEMAFEETEYCVSDCFDTLTHTAQCQYLNPVHAAVAGWRKSVSIAVRLQEAA